ncbi:MAG: hypothetical protein J6O39_05380 [Treponema sp.]|nr:hypothetical protein [Treponema sp.]
MANSDSEFKASKTLEPGTIDKIRQNIGPIDPLEAQSLANKLGGEVLRERASAPDTSNMPRHRQHTEVIRATGRSASDISAASGALSSTTNKTQMASVNQIVTTSTVKRKKTEEDLPALTARDLKLIDRVMMDPEYDIKPNLGLFNFLFRISQKNREKVTKKFGEYTVKKHIEHMQAFISTIKTFIQLSPDHYKSKIATETDLKFKFLRTIGKWSMRDIKVLALDVENAADNLTVSMLIPFVRAVYHELITIYYIGEQQIPALIKEIYTDITAYPDADKAKMQMLAKQGITEWIYIYNQVIKGMYPLLMRMCTSEYVEFPRFFTAQIANILQFVNHTKFDLLLPEKNKKKPEDDKKKTQEEAKKKLEQNRHVAGKKDELVISGLKMLEQLFPKAGFSALDAHPDMYPYFQPLFDFEDGFNMLHPENPLQVTVVLIKIIEEFLQGCRNINFNIKADEKLSELPDDFNLTLSEWASYHEDLFDKKYCDYFKNYVNSIYSQKDYARTQYGKETLNNFLWRAKYWFLPHYKFNAPILQKPSNDSRYKPLYARTDYLRTVFTTLVQRIDQNAAGKKTVLGIMNPWDRYQFDLPNVISKRLDVLLGAKRPDDVTNATNANLIKYTLCMISVLDWWINNASSPAYTSNTENQYRVSAKDGSPEFSVPVRTDQNALFAENIKKSMAARAKK